MCRKKSLWLVVCIIWGSSGFCVGKVHCDTTYLSILKKFEDVLNKEIPGHNFRNVDGVPIMYFVIDLIDTLNVGNLMTNKQNDYIKFRKNHVYHVVPVFRKIGYSFIFFLSDCGKVEVFKFIDCKKRNGDKLEYVIKFAQKFFYKNPDKEYLLERIRMYRSSVQFLTPMDNYGEGEPNCN